MKYIICAFLTCSLLIASGCSDRTASNDELEQQQSTQQISQDIDEDTTEDFADAPAEFEGGVVKHDEDETADDNIHAAQTDTADDTDDTDDSADTANEEKADEKQVSAVQFDDSFLMLVNSTHPLAEGYTPELAYVQGEYRVDKRILQVSQQMIADARKDGVELLVCSAYRPVESQTRLFNNKVNEWMSVGKSKDEAVALTSALIAVPGTSEHHTGLALDIVTPSYQSLDEGFAKTSAFAWLDKHAADYGFIMRYPADKTDITKIDYESWHYRYVGVEAAREIKAGGLCLEEYLGEIS
ncbi:MAG: M15 family metallopeptidase [Oscillospiraceae bacterium]|nr:M15 family metallopeptidase [Oscillospiraceae bacterium]